MKATESDLAYAAGIVDGEGCIQIQNHKTEHKPMVMLQAEAVLARKITEFHSKRREVEIPVIENKEQGQLF